MRRLKCELWKKSCHDGLTRLTSYWRESSWKTCVLSNQLTYIYVFLHFFLSSGISVMGVKMLQCFPFYRRCKERCKSRQCSPPPGEHHLLYIPTVWENQMQNKPLDSLSATRTVPVEEMKPRLSSTTSWGSDSEGTGSINRGSQIYFSTKARLSFRHQLDSNINAVDATYWGRPRAS